MREKSINRCTRLLAVALLVTAGLSAAQQHAHSGGDRAHRHQAGGAVALAGERTIAVPQGWFAAPLHLHILLLGFQFTLPGGQESNDEAAAAADTFVLVKLAGDSLSDAVAQAPASCCCFAADRSISCDATTVEAVQTFWRPLPCHAQPLCDSARHERTGVQRS